VVKCGQTRQAAASLLALVVLLACAAASAAQVEEAAHGPHGESNTAETSELEPFLPPMENSPAAKKKLDGQTRKRATAALGGLVILGLGLIAFAWLSARMTRRYMKSGERGKTTPVDSAFTDDWAHKPLTPEERERLAREEW
jgi:hypothetical protein